MHPISRQISAFVQLFFAATVFLAGAPLRGAESSGHAVNRFRFETVAALPDGTRAADLPSSPSGEISVTQSDGAADRVYLFSAEGAYSLDPADKTRRRETPPPRPLDVAGGCAYGICSIFLFGDEVFLYNTITKTWTIPYRLPENVRATGPARAQTIGKELRIVFPVRETDGGGESDRIGVFHVVAQKRFTPLDYAVLGVYMLAMLGIGFLFMRKESSTDDFFLGGGRLPWWAVGISLFATTLSAITFLSVPAKAFATDWSMFPYNLGTLLVAPIIIRFYLPYFRGLNIDTAYAYLELRFNRAVRFFASGLFVLFMVARTAIVLYLPSLALNIVTGLDVSLCIVVMSLVTILYCTMGGMEAVVWGDVVQGVILVVGALVSLVVLVAWSDGGATGFFETACAAGKFRIFDLAFDWTRPVFWVVMLGAFSNNLITYSSDQTLVQRYMCTTDRRQTVRSIWLNAILAIPVILLFFPLGTALFTYYRTNPDQFDAGLRNPDAIYPLFIVNGLPPGVSGLVIAAIFAAAMSTLSSNINSASAALTSDFLKILFPKTTARFSVSISRLNGVLVGLAGMSLALFLATCDIKSLWDQFNTFLGLLTGSLGGLFLMGVFSKRINGTGALIGLAASFATVCVVHLYTPISFLLFGFLGMTSCYVYGLAAGLLERSPPKTVVFRPEDGETH